MSRTLRALILERLPMVIELVRVTSETGAKLRHRLGEPERPVAGVTALRPIHLHSSTTSDFRRRLGLR